MQITSSRKQRIAAGIFSVIVLVAGIARLVGHGRIDPDDADKKLAAWASEKVAPVRSVDCPHRIEEKSGATFDCKVTFEAGRVATIHVVESDDKGDVTYGWAPPIVNAERMSAVFAPGLTGSWKGAAIDCGTGIRDLPPDGLRCTATQGAQHEHVVIRVHGDDLVATEEP